jgi:imidazole glycerol-phosphate synthase subunit HisH
LSSSNKIILPGVGAFDQTIGHLHESGLEPVLQKLVVEKSIPVLGICVGMQIMGDSSEEGKKNGLGWISGTVRKFDENKLMDKPKIPHLGWNSVHAVDQINLFEGIDIQKGFYFIHSYYFDPVDTENIMSITRYGDEFASAIHKSNIYGVQFHPEKSHSNGIKLLKNFAEL